MTVEPVSLLLGALLAGLVGFFSSAGILALSYLTGTRRTRKRLKKTLYVEVLTIASFVKVNKKRHKVIIEQADKENNSTSMGVPLLLTVKTFSTRIYSSTGDLGVLTIKDLGALAKFYEWASFVQDMYELNRETASRASTLYEPDLLRVRKAYSTASIQAMKEALGAYDDLLEAGNAALASLRGEKERHVNSQ